MHFRHGMSPVYRRIAIIADLFDAIVDVFASKASIFVNILPLTFTLTVHSVSLFLFSADH